MSESIRGSNVSQSSLRVSRIAFNAWIRVIPCRLHIGIRRGLCSSRIVQRNLRLRFSSRSLTRRRFNRMLREYNVAWIQRASIDFFKRLKNYAHFSRLIVVLFLFFFFFLFLLSDIYTHMYIDRYRYNIAARKRRTIWYSITHPFE